MNFFEIFLLKFAGFLYRVCGVKRLETVSVPVTAGIVCGLFGIFFGLASLLYDAWPLYKHKHKGSYGNNR